jgi:hypothetical protein
LARAEGAVTTRQTVALRRQSKVFMPGRLWCPPVCRFFHDHGPYVSDHETADTMDLLCAYPDFFLPATRADPVLPILLNFYTIEL